MTLDATIEAMIAGGAADPNDIKLAGQLAVGLMRLIAAKPDALNGSFNYKLDGNVYKVTVERR